MYNIVTIYPQISLFDIRRRYREIAIRKVNGAKPKDLYILLGKNYMLNLVLAFVVAAPVSWIVIYYYTASFVEKASVTFGLFVIPLFIVLILSIVDSIDFIYVDFILSDKQGGTYQSCRSNEE